MTPIDKTRIRVQAELSLAIALAAVLSLVKIKLPHLLYGGSVSLETLPLFLVSLRHGLRLGILSGAAYGVVNFVMAPYYLHPLQVLLDYPLAYGAVGIAGIAQIGSGSSGSWFRTATAVALSEIVRLCLHFLSGIVYFGHYAPPDTPVWQYSLGYNASYLVPEAIIDLILVPMLLRRIP